MKYIIGLGNPTKQYKNTRHNVGQDIIFMLEKVLKPEFLEMNKSRLVTFDCYMNESGISVKKLLKNVKPDSDNKNILVIHDDLDQKIGNMKMTYDGNSGGHNGINSIYDHLKTKKYYRLKIGISSEIKTPKDEVHDFVVGKFSKIESEIIAKLKKRVVEAVTLFIEGNEGRAVETSNKK